MYVLIDKLPTIYHTHTHAYIYSFKFKPLFNQESPINIKNISQGRPGQDRQRHKNTVTDRKHTMKVKRNLKRHNQVIFIFFMCGNLPL